MNNHLNYLFIFSLLTASPTVFGYTYGNPTAAEQAHLEAINRARANPQAEAQRLGFDLFEGTSPGAISGDPLPPLVLNAQLSKAARQHSQDMAARDFFDHNSPEGTDPFERMETAGYQFRAAGENIAFTASTATLDAINSSLALHDILFQDEDYPARGHRVNILSPDFKEIGVGLAAGSLQRNGTTFNAYYVTTDFATAKADEYSFIVGVVYEDHDQDGAYTAGEGMADVAITVVETNEQTVTADAGGYGLPLAEGQYTVQFSHPILGQVIRTVTLAAENIKLDVQAQAFVAGDNDNNEPLFPDLGQANAVNALGMPINTATTFTGGIALNGGSYQTQVMQKLADTVNIVGQIKADPADVGKTVDIFVYAEVELPPLTGTFYYMLDEASNILVWDQNPANLSTFKANLSLQAVEEFVLYQGYFLLPGALKLFFGYRYLNCATSPCSDSVIVYNSQPVDVEITL